MKVITILIAGGLLFAVAGQSTSSDNSQKPQPRKVTKAPEPTTIPRDATPLPDGSYRYIDKDGKKWIYRATPFGVSKAEERPAPPVRKVEDDPTKSEDLGDSVRFTRPTPFGNKVWTTKKSQLDSFEKTIWERDQNRKSGNDQSDAAKQEADHNDKAHSAAKPDAAKSASK